MIDRARVVNVIVVEEGANRIYFTLEGVEIGSFVAGKKIAPKSKPPEEKKPKSGVVKSPTPKEAKVQKERELEENMTLEKRKQNAIESNLSV